jgi:hypothetical protein
MGDAGKFADGMTSCIRTIALVEPDKKFITFRNMAGEAAHYVVEGGVERRDFADKFFSAAISNGIVQSHGTDAVQAVLDEALTAASALKIAEISDYPAPRDDPNWARVGSCWTWDWPSRPAELASTKSSTKKEMCCISRSKTMSAGSNRE